MAERLRIATFNLENLDDRGGAAAEFEGRLDVLAPQLIRLRADVLCLQEVNAHGETRHGPRQLTALDRLLADTPYASYHRVASVNRKGLRISEHHNLVILSRLPVLSHRQLWHDLVPPPRHLAPGGGEIVIEWDRPLLSAEIALAGGARLHLLNLHLRAPRAAFIAGHKEHGVWQSVGGWAEGHFLATVKAAGQALEARLLIDSIFDSDPAALVLACGDFNAEDREAPLRIIRGDEEDTRNGRLAGRCLVPVERSLADSRRHSVIHHGRRLMLDHILVSRRLLGWYRSAEVHNEALGDELVSPSLIAAPPDSYHAAMVAEFDLAPP
ncbi:MAG TPA: endonuclease [Rhodospirillaceae bacterium]|nr:endonuclease [Rhodospirillaceae bacterium]